ncbi:MAG: hypothetical protein LKI17_06435 [Megasphaera cerevisiae]|jgi:uncharacterized coiled-coil DUF342 family protein|nr:hypothetical protein [Megasphaera cerevisiae]
MTIDLGEALAVGAVVCGGVIWVCRSLIAPLKEILERIGASLDELNETIKDEQRQRHALEVWVQKIDDRGKSNQHRIDDIETEIRQIGTGGR